jgi:sugar/nucleoside kinase (ribokinase family)
MAEDQPSYDSLIFGGYFCDLIVTGLPELPRLGMDLFGTGFSMLAGGSFNTVRAMHRLGAHVGWVCDFGDDMFSQFVLDEVRQEGVDPALFRLHARPLRSFSLSFSYADDRGFISFMDPVEPVERVPYILKYRPRSVVLCHLVYGPELLALSEAARQAGARIYMDCQASDATLETPGVVESLRLVDALLPNASEALRMTGATSLEQATEMLGEHTPLVVIKKGCEGALGWQSGSLLQVPALPVEVLDTTGAGDCFDAGFIFSQLRGDPLETSLRFGVICGSLSTTGYGASAAPTLEQVERLL